MNLRLGHIHLLGSNTRLSLLGVGLCPSAVEVSSGTGRGSPRSLFDADRLNLDEAGRVCRLEPTKFIHRRFPLVIQPLIPKYLSDSIPITIQDRTYLVG